MNTEAIKNAVALAAQQYGADAYEIDINVEESAGAEALQQEISSVTYAKSGHMQIRCIKGGKSGSAVSDLITPEAAAQLVAQACANAGIVDDTDTVDLFAGSESYATVSDAAAELPSAEEMKAHTLDLQAKAYAASDKIVDGTQSFTSGVKISNALINSKGLDLSYDCSLVYHGVAAAVKDGDDAANDYRLKPVDAESAEDTARKAVESALAQLGADTMDSGKYPIIMNTSAMSSLLGTYSEVFSARSAYMKTSLLAGREGEKVGSDVLTLVDDPFHPAKFGHCPYDGEGVATYAKNVIENGVLNTLLYNRMYAKLMGKETTGNASDAKHISPKGLYIAPGQLTAEALMEKMGNGIYVTGLNGLHAGANTQSGDFSLQAEGYLVEGGKKVRPVKNFTIADNFFSLLKKVEAVSDTVEFRTGGSFGAPEVLFSQISVSGR